jgi:tryptophan halogenase
MLQEVRSVVIVGGGTSAWLTAAMLSNSVPNIHVTVVDKEIGSPVGVGEGTLLSFDMIMKKAGFKVEEWFFELDATFKSGILFPGWGETGDKNVWHPFLFPEQHQINTHLLNIWSKNQEYDFKTYGLGMYDTSVNHNKVDVGTKNAYAYHVDASKLVQFIQRKLKDRTRVESIKSEVVEIERDSHNNISKLILKNTREITGDLFVDCTGFKGILNDAPDRVDLTGRLFCDTAVAGHVPYKDRDKELHPYVISELVKHGWVWNIPVQSRIGSGLVFNRTQTSVEEAKDFFCEYWDHRISKDNLKVIDWAPYYNKNMWHDNVVSIGLSAGFIEPLESTGIALIIIGIEQLIFRLGSRYYTEFDIAYYNNVMTSMFEDSIDFINMHYSKVDREDKFWKWVRETHIKSDRQEFYEYQLLRTDCPLPTSGGGLIFGASNWFAWLIQLGYKVNPACDGLTSGRALEEILYYHDNIESTRHARSIKHVDYLENLKTSQQVDK